MNIFLRLSTFLSNLPHKMLQHKSHDCFLLLNKNRIRHILLRIINVSAVAVQGQQIFSGCFNVVTGKWSMIIYNSQGSAAVMKEKLQTDCLLGGSMLMSRLSYCVTLPYKTLQSESKRSSLIVIYRMSHVCKNWRKKNALITQWGAKGERGKRRQMRWVRPEGWETCLHRLIIGLSSGEALKQGLEMKALTHLAKMAITNMTECCWWIEKRLEPSRIVW